MGDLVFVRIVPNPQFTRALSVAHMKITKGRVLAQKGCATFRKQLMKIMDLKCMFLPDHSAGGGPPIPQTCQQTLRCFSKHRIQKSPHSPEQPLETACDDHIQSTAFFFSSFSFAFFAFSFSSDWVKSSLQLRVLFVLVTRKPDWLLAYSPGLGGSPPRI